MSDMSTAKPAPWGVVATFGWLVLSLVIGQAAAVAGLLVWFGEDSLARVSVSLFDGPLLAVTTVISNAAQIGVLAFAVRRRGWRVSDYLALGAFARREFALGVLACAAVAGMIALFGWLANLELVTPFQIQAYMTTPKNLWLAAVFFAVVIAGPLGEEIVFRGFLFRGWARPGGHPLVAIVVISLLWAIQHVQYDWFGILQVFVLGLLFGLIRWLSGSTLLTFVLHALVNVEATIETVIKVEWM